MSANVKVAEDRTKAQTYIVDLIALSRRHGLVVSFGQEGLIVEEIGKVGLYWLEEAEYPVPGGTRPVFDNAPTALSNLRVS